MISVGGWLNCKYYSDCAASEKNRSILTDSMIKFTEYFNFEGVYLDWEFPVEGGPENEKVTK